MTKDPDTGVRNVGTYSVMVKKEPNEVVVSFANQSHLLIQVQKNESQGKATEIAIVIGADPTVGMVSTTPMPYELDEFAVAGGLRGAPLELVKCETVDLEVPSTAEIVIEGRLFPKQQRAYEPQGPFGEHTGYQGACIERPVMEFQPRRAATRGAVATKKRKKKRKRRAATTRCRSLAVLPRELASPAGPVVLAR